MAEPEGTGDGERTWFERNAFAASAVLLGVPLLIAMGLRRIGVSDTVAELTQLVVGVASLIVVCLVIVRARR